MSDRRRSQRRRGGTVEDWRPDPWDSPDVALRVREREGPQAAPVAEVRRLRRASAILVVMVLAVGAVGLLAGPPARPARLARQAGELHRQRR